MTVLALAVSGRRAYWLYTLIKSGQPAHDRTAELNQRIKAQFVEVFGQRKLLRWSVPGLAHFFTFWAFVILITVYLEAYGALFDHDFHIPLIGRWPLLGFLQDFIASAALISLGVFSVIRIRNAPDRLQRASRFYGSHTGGAWLILFMIFNVLWTMFFFRGASAALGVFPYESGAFVSIAVGNLFSGMSDSALFVLESIGLLLHIGVMLVFTVIIAYSKHLHIFTAPLNVSAKRLPKALGPLAPIEHEGRPIDFEDPPEEAAFGRGKVEDFTWKGMLDFATCTECGRCQSQCPAWNTGKPLSPKLLVMDERDHLFDVGATLLAAKRESEEAFQAAVAELPPLNPQIVEDEVIWDCTTCGACVQACPVNIEHIDSIVDMRRNLVMGESRFPREMQSALNGMETTGNPWGQPPNARTEWTKGTSKQEPLEVPHISEAPDAEVLFWVGCAGAYDDRNKKVVYDFARLMQIAGVKFAVLGADEQCTGDPARRMGAEYIFQMLAEANVEAMNANKVKKIVTICPHCFNTIFNEYPQYGGNFEDIHHKEFLADLV